MTRYPKDNLADEKPDRYQRQALLPQIGSAGQARLGQARVLLVGCGALGCHLADQLARAGVGFVRLVDRDIVELTNLQRQTLFGERDLEAAKAAAAARRLAEINSGIAVEPRVTDLWAGNVEELADGIDLILDGTDNVQTRYLLNDIAVEKGIDWIHAACVAVEGRVMVVRPAESACLRCVYPQPPPAKELATCDTAGILQPAAAAVASLQAAQAIKVLIGAWTAKDQRLWKLDIWEGRLTAINLQDARQNDCPCCGRREFPYLLASGAESVTALCGRNAVQIRPAKAWTARELSGAIERLHQAGQVEPGLYFSRCRLWDLPGVQITCFADGRLLVDGTADTGRARAICARIIGA